MCLLNWKFRIQIDNYRLSIGFYPHYTFSHISHACLYGPNQSYVLGVLHLPKVYWPGYMWTSNLELKKKKEQKTLDKSRKGVNIKLDRENRNEVWWESVWRWACWERVKGSNHASEREEGANKQQSWKKSDKDEIDSRTTGRVECDEGENDVRDKAEWHKCHHANLLCTLTLSSSLCLYSSSPSRSEALQRWTPNGQHGSQLIPSSN